MKKQFKRFMRENKFEVSDYNLMVLETIPLMMKEKEWRNKLRKLVLEYKSNKILGVKKCIL